jgi:hypothetical protein
VGSFKFRLGGAPDVDGDDGPAVIQQCAYGDQKVKLGPGQNWPAGTLAITILDLQLEAMTWTQRSKCTYGDPKVKSGPGQSRPAESRDGYHDPRLSTLYDISDPHAKIKVVIKFSPCAGRRMMPASLRTRAGLGRRRGRDHSRARRERSQSNCGAPGPCPFLAYV